MANKQRIANAKRPQGPRAVDRNQLVRANLSAAAGMWGRLVRSSRERLKILSQNYRLNVAAGELCLLDGRWYVTHAGLLSIAEHRHCCGIKSAVENSLCDPAGCRWVFKATVY